VSYVAAVEAADGEPLEFGVAKAINDFVLGCKNDGIWDAIKASCILAGARTLSGALVPLVGTAPTSYNFVSGDYNRETGLVGDGSMKYLDSNRNNNADPQDNNHNAVYVSVLPTSGVSLMGAGVIDAGTNNVLTRATRSRNATALNYNSDLISGFAGHARSTSATYINRANGVSVTNSQLSEASFDGNLFLFARSIGGEPDLFADPRIAFYSIGESIDLAKLDTRVSALITAIGAAIP